MSTAVTVFNLYDFALGEAKKSAEARELKRISDETELGYSWLSKFARGKIPGASYVHVRTLADWYIAKGRAPAGMTLQ